MTGCPVQSIPGTLSYTINIINIFTQGVQVITVHMTGWISFIYHDIFAIITLDIIATSVIITLAIKLLHLTLIYYNYNQHLTSPVCKLKLRMFMRNLAQLY